MLSPDLRSGTDTLISFEPEPNIQILLIVLHEHGS